MKLPIIKSLALTGVAVMGTALFSPAVFADATQTQMYQANLTSLNNSGTTGTATVEVTGDQATVKLTTKGASANLPHAQHIHVGGNGVCPTMADDKNKDGVLTTVEGQPDYGMIKVSLTTSGDNSAGSALAVDRFPTASADGMVTYSRTFTLPSGVSASDVASGVIVQHGVASLTGDKTKYDGNEKSDLDKNLPREATVPSACGKLMAMPVGGANTGGGSTAGTEYSGLMIAGGATLVAGASVLAFRKRFVANQA